MTTRNPDTTGRDINRRDFLSSTAAVGGAMVLGFWLPETGCARAPAQTGVGERVAAQP
jgi:hypothetical protein